MSKMGALLDRMTAHLPALDAEAVRCDREGGVPEAALALLHAEGALRAPLPPSSDGPGDGLGLGTTPQGGLGLMRLLRLIAYGNLSLARLFEGHVNALKLVTRYGGSAQRYAAAQAVCDGALFGIWVTDADAPVRLHAQGNGFVLEGSKAFASGALHVTRPLITALTPDGETRMVLVALDGNRKAEPTLGGLTGMRGTATGRCDFTGLAVGRQALIGSDGDYLRQPEFSAGAWRGMAAALGGIDRLVDELCGQLAARGRDSNPHQRVRIGMARLAQETAAMWTRKAALAAEGETLEDDAVAATVNLARIAVERAGLEVIGLVQRGLGLSGFLQTNPAERVMRDLTTFLRQPAPDETLTEAAAFFTTRPVPAAGEPS